MGKRQSGESEKESIVARLDALVRDLNQTVPPALHENLELIRKLDQLLTNAEKKKQKLDRTAELLIAQTKQDLAWQTYELLDNSITKLDQVLVKMDLHPSEAVRKRTAVITRKVRKSHGTGDSALNMAVDPNEPTYCICGQVAFGKMVSCDGPNCEKEWFHVQCVGEPEHGAKWYCPSCAKEMAEDESTA